jgi:hypothetical protein
MSDLAAHYMDEIGRQLRGYKRLAEGAVAQVTDSELFLAIDVESNSIAIVLKHMAGNMRSRFSDFLTTDGEKPDRNRDREFVMSSGTSRNDLLQWWEEGWEILFATLASLKPDDLQGTVTIRGQPHTVLQALNRQLAHYAYHTGQIVFIAKHFRGTDWNSLSIPKGHSEPFNAQMEQKFSKHKD